MESADINLLQAMAIDDYTLLSPAPIKGGGEMRSAGVGLFYIIDLWDRVLRLRLNATIRGCYVK